MGALAANALGSRLRHHTSRVLAVLANRVQAGRLLRRLRGSAASPGEPDDPDEPGKPGEVLREQSRASRRRRGPGGPERLLQAALEAHRPPVTCRDAFKSRRAAGLLSCRAVSHASRAHAQSLHDTSRTDSAAISHSRPAPRSAVSCRARRHRRSSLNLPEVRCCPLGIDWKPYVSGCPAQSTSKHQAAIGQY